MTGFSGTDFVTPKRFYEGYYVCDAFPAKDSGSKGNLPKISYFRHYDIDLGSSFGRITSVLPTILKLSVRY